MRAFKGLAVLMMVTAFMAGCGGDDDEEGGGGDTAVSRSTTTSPEQAKAEAAVLTLADLPAGFRELPLDRRLDHETTWSELLACLSEDPKKGRVAVATGPSFQKDLGTQVSTTVEYKDDVGGVDELVAAFSSAGFAACAQKAYAVDIERNAPCKECASDIKVAAQEFNRFGESTIAYRATGKLAFGPGVLVTTDFVVVFNGTAITRVTFINPSFTEVPQPFPEDVQRSTVEKVAARA